MPILPTVGGDKDAWGTELLAWLLAARNADGSLKNLRFVTDPAYGADPTGAADSTSAIQAAINAGAGNVYFPAGTYKISSNLTMPNANTSLVGAGGQATVIQPTASFSGSQIILITADFCSIRDLTIAYANTTTGSNPSADGIRMTGCRSGTIFNVYCNYINGWAFHSTATASVANYWWQFINAHSFQCTDGIRIAGNASSGYNMAHSLTNCIMDQVTGGDAYQIADAHDVLIVNAEGSPLSGTGATVHITGASKAIYVVNGDLGPAPGPASGATVLIDASGGNSPQQVSLINTIVEGGATGITISAGSQLMFRNCDVLRSGTHGFAISGAADSVLISGCLFDQNGATAGSGHYEINSSTSGGVAIETCWFQTPQGTSANQVANVINATAGYVSVQNSTFYGTSFNSSNIFNGFPKIIRNCRNYNPLGGITPPSVPASGVNASTQSIDMTVYVKGGTLTAITVGGVATGISAAAPAGAVHTIRVPAQQTINITYSVAPTWTWFGD
jgi:hypothetical protein